jgi:hypothetical protein
MTQLSLVPEVRLLLSRLMLTKLVTTCHLFSCGPELRVSSLVQVLAYVQL